MKIMNKCKMILLLAAAALLLTATVGGTIAYLSTSTGTVKNVFDPARVVPVIQETMSADMTTKSDIYIKNNGNVDAYIRVTYVVNWRSTAEGGTAFKPIDANQYSITFEDGWREKWKQVGNDYYYMDEVAPGDSTSILIRECKLADGKTPPMGYALNVEILAQAIQTTPAEALDAANWAWRPDSSGDENTALSGN